MFYNNLGVNDHILNIAKISIYYKNTNYDKFAMGDMAVRFPILDKKLMELVMEKSNSNENSCDVLKEFEVDIYLFKS